MAEIYLAAPAEGNTSQRVAIKVIHPQNATDPDFVRMLVDEAKLAVQLEHPNIVCTYDLGRENDEYYIVMEYIEGADLFKVQQRAAAKRLSFPIAFGAYVTREVTRGLDFAHRLKDAEGRPLYIVHRDISPQNVLVSFAGEVKITDFGIAKAAHRAEQTQAGIIKGKYYYMSPEQASGHVIDARTDVFASGILLYELLVGEMLYFDEDIDKLLAMVRRADIPPPSRRRRDVPEALEAIVLKALSKRPEDRFQTADEYGAALEAFLRDFAPDYSADDLGVFVMRIMDAPRQRSGRSFETTAQVAVPHESNEYSPTIGLSGEQVARLGVHDENSLLYKHSGALFEQLASKLHAPRGEDGGALPREGTREDSKLETKRRLLGKELDAELELLEQTLSDPSQSKPPGEAPPAALPGPPAQHGARDRAMWSGKRLTRKNFAPKAQAASEAGAFSDDAHERPTLSHDIVPPVPPSAADDPSDDAPTLFRPGRSAISSAIEPPAVREDAPTLFRPGRSAVRSASEMPAVGEDAARAVYAAAAAELLSSSVGELRSSPRFEPILEPLPSEAYVGLAASEEDASGLGPNGGRFEEEPRVELTQTDLDTSGLERRAGTGRRRGLDNISLDPRPLSSVVPASPSSQSQGPPSEPSVPERGRLGYVLAGIGATVVSALLTWELTLGPSRSRPPLAPPRPDAAASASPTLDVRSAPPAGPPPALPSPSEASAAALVDEPPEIAADGTEEAVGEQAKTAAKAAPAQAGKVQLTSTPPGAQVYLRKKLVGTTPLLLHELPLDSDVKVELRLKGYKRQRRSIKWQGTDHLTLNVKLRSGSGTDTDDAETVPEPPAKDPAAKEAAQEPKSPAEN